MREDKVTKEIEERRREEYEKQIKRIKAKREALNSTYKWLFIILFSVFLLSVGAKAYSNGLHETVISAFKENAEEMPTLNDDSVISGEGTEEAEEVAEEKNAD